MPDECRSCHQPIVWVETTKGRRMPVDPEPVYAGNIVLRDREHLPPLELYRKPDEGTKRYISHFVTCPQRDKWRRKPQQS